MATLDPDALAGEISPDSPSGEDLSADPAYFAILREAEGTAEQQVGDSVIEAQEPNWREILDGAIPFLRRSHDLQIAIVAALASLRVKGLSGFADGIELLNRLLTDRWETLYPQLDPDDDNDPMERMNILSVLGAPLGTPDDKFRFAKRLFESVAVESRQVGRVTIGDLLASSGAMEPIGGSAPPGAELIAAAFRDVDQEILEQIAVDAARASTSLDGLAAAAATHAPGMSPDLSWLSKGVAAVARAVNAELGSRGVAVPDEDGPVAVESGGDRVAAASPGEISSPADVERAIQRIIDYYERHEPSSPLPLLLKRSKRLVSKPFLEIMEDLSPDSLERVHLIGGIDPPSDD